MFLCVAILKSLIISQTTQSLKRKPLLPSLSPSPVATQTPLIVKSMEGHFFFLCIYHVEKTVDQLKNNRYSLEKPIKETMVI